MAQHRSRSRPLQWVDIDLRALRANFATFQRMLAPTTNLLPVVKGNAYGHGAVLIAQALANLPKWGYGVANLEEAQELRANGIRNRILILSYFSPAALKMKDVENTSFVVFDRSFATELQRIAKRMRRVLPVHLKIDTGTGRIGVLPKDVQQFFQHVQRCSHLRVEGVFSHFADAENPKQGFTDLQFRSFLTVKDSFHWKHPPIYHIACTASALTHPQSHGQLARFGIGLYGLWPSAGIAQDAEKGSLPLLLPVLSWKTRLLQVKTVPRGSSVGYARTFTTPKQLTYGVLPVGYSDGFDRGFSNRAYTLVGGKRCRILGRVSMHLSMVDLTHVVKPFRGQEVVLIGRQGREVVTAEELATTLKTIHYEVVTRIHPRIPRFPV